MTLRPWVLRLALALTTTSAFGAAPHSARIPTAEINLSRGALPSAPALGGAGLQATLSPMSPIIGVQARAVPTSAAPSPVQGPVPLAVTPAAGPLGAAKALPRAEAKSFLLDALDARPSQPALTIGRINFDGAVTSRAAEIDPAAASAARRARVPASRSPAALRHLAPQQDPPKPVALVQMHRSPATEMVLNNNATRLLQGAQKWHDNVVKYAPGWQKASLAEAIERHMGSGYRIVISKSGKAIYENASNGRQIVIDAGNGYFRIFQPNSPGSFEGRYLNLDGEVPMAEIMTKKGLRRVPLTGGELNQATHFILQSSPRTTAPPRPS